MTKHSGVIRRVDDLGRIVIPKEMRNFMNVNEGDPYEISCTDNGFILEKYVAGEEMSVEVKEETEKRKILVEIRKCDSDYLTYLKLSPEMWKFLEWLERKGMIDADVIFDDIKEIPVIEF